MTPLSTCAARVGLVLLSLTLGLAAPVASAADLGGSLKDPYPAEPPPVRYNWSGLYFGGYVGGAHGLWTIDFYRNNNHGHAEEGLDGFAGGGWVGYNMMLDQHWLVGLEGELGATSADQHNEVFDNDKTDTEYGMFGAIRGRVGYAWDRLLIFGTAGWAFLNIDENIQKGQNAGEQVVYEGKTPSGYTLGAGLEYAFTNNLIGRAEYVYANFGSESMYNADGNLAVFENELHIVRAGLSYKF